MTIIVMGVIFGLRGVSLVPEVVVFVRSAGDVPVGNLLYSLAALLIGLRYLVGLGLRARSSS